jgi:putative two-component system response regulator
MQKTIFMVDDNVTNLAKAEEALENDYLVITLSAAEKMFTVLEKVIPDLILLDIDMPGMDGLETIKLLKANSKYSDIPVIFLTGLTNPDTEAYCIELGAVDFIAKPFSEPVLLNRIRNHLHIAELLRERTELPETALI